MSAPHSDAARLFLDLDGVLGDFDGYYFSQFGVVLDRGQVDPPGLWENIERHGSFYASLPLMPDALDLWTGAAAMYGHEPIILTGISSHVAYLENQAHERQKRLWVREFISPTATVICCASKHKRLYGKAGDVLVDDWNQYQPLWEGMGGRFVLHTSVPSTLARLGEIFQ